MSAGEGSAFGILLKRHRLAAGLTQEELAEQAHLSVRAVSALEQGVNRAPRKDTVTLLAAALALPVSSRAAFEAAARGREAPASMGAAARHAPGAHPPLVGRARELAVLDRHLAGEAPPVLLLAGEPGIGKSRLLREAAALASAHGLAVLGGGCQRRGGQESYAPLVEVLTRHIDQQTEAGRRAALRGCAWLTRLLPDLARSLEEPLPDWSVTAEQERRLLIGAVGRFLSNVSGPGGVLLLLDDLQWAGSDALDLLAALVRTRAGTAPRMVGAYRDTEAPRTGPLATLVGDLAHAGLVWHRSLLPLPLEEARQLLEQQLPGLGEMNDALRERLLQRTGGLPFFLLSCAQAIRQGEGGADVVPWDLAASVRQRIAALSEPAQRLLGTAAVIGRSVPHAVLAAVIGQPEADLVLVLEEACRARLLLEEQEIGAYRFVHDVIREVAEADLSASRRALLHRRIAEALEQRSGEPPVEALAYHYSQADIQDPALRYLELAGDRAQSRYAHAAAEEHFVELLRRLDRLGYAHEAARVREKLGSVQGTMARLQEALATLEQAAAVYAASEDLERLGWVTARIGQVYRLMPAPEEGLARIRPVLATLEAGGPSQGLAALYSTLAHLSFAAGGRYDDQLAAATRAADLARLVGTAQLLIDAEECRGSALIMMGRVEEGARIVEAAIPWAESLRDQETLLRDQETLGLLCWRMAKLHVFRGEWDRAMRYAERAKEALTRLGDLPEQAGVLGTFGAIAFLSGDWAQARVHAEQEAAMDATCGPTWVRPYVLLDQGQMRLAEGPWDEAARYLEVALEWARRCTDLQAIRQAEGLLAECDLLTGRLEAARDRLAVLGDRPGMEEPDITALLPILARALLDLGDATQAEAVAASAVGRSRATGYRLMLVEALRAHTLAATRLHAWSDARQALTEGLFLARAMPFPQGQMRLLEADAVLHLALGKPVPARERLQEALTIARRLGARGDAVRLEQRAVSMGTDVRSVT